MKRQSFGTLLTCLAVTLAACHDGGPAGADLPPVPAGVAAVHVAVNGRSSPPVDEPCPRGLFVSTAIDNLSSRPLAVRDVFVDFEALAGGCASHRASIDPSLNVVVAPGSATQVHVFNAAGTLCEAPTGRPGCSWRATARVATDAGLAVGTVDFSAASIAGRAGCDSVASPRVLAPRAGETVSGVVAVQATVVEGAGCNISARSIIWAYSEAGVAVGHSVPIDLGDAWHWDTRPLSNGRYSLRAEQNCCHVLGTAVEVTVRN